VADRVDPGMNRTQPTRRKPVLDRASTDAELGELAPAGDSVLSSRKPRNRLVVARARGTNVGSATEEVRESARVADAPSLAAIRASVARAT
jgi:hypothetical protein